MSPLVRTCLHHVMLGTFGATLMLQPASAEASPESTPVDRTSACVVATPADITATLDRWQSALTGGDADAIAGLYAEDAVLLPAMSEPPRVGRAAIRGYFAEFLRRHPVPVITMRSTMAGCGMASEIGTASYRVTGQRKGTRMVVGGRYFTVLAHRDGRWLIVQQSLALMSQLNRKVALAR